MFNWTLCDTLYVSLNNMSEDLSDDYEIVADDTIGYSKFQKYGKIYFDFKINGLYVKYYFDGSKEFGKHEIMFYPNENIKSVDILGVKEVSEQ